MPRKKQRPAYTKGMRAPSKLVLSLLTLLIGNCAVAQEWPSRPIRLVVPFTPGGSTDLLARAISHDVGKSLGQPVVIDNIPGAGGSLGAEKVAKAAPDGYTLLMGHIGTLAVNPGIYPKLAYKPLQDFTAIAWVARVPNVLAVASNSGINSLQDLIAKTRARPGQMNYGSGGNGSAAHITMEYLKWQLQIPIVHIPYRGTAPSITDLLAGHVQASFTGIPALLPHIRAGKLKALAVSSTQRLAQLPDVPTVAQSGLKGSALFEADQWYGVVAPAGTPAAIVQLLNRKINAALANTEVKTKLDAEGAIPMPTTPAAFAAHMAAELPRWSAVIKAASITAD
jgi:tripartite-type tricarboxylate transporter receptor subunit TctC